MWAPWSSGHRSGLRSERSGVQISSDAKYLFIYLFIWLPVIMPLCPIHTSALRTNFHIAKEEEDGGKTRIVPKSSRDWNNQRRLLRGKMDVQKEQAQLEEHLH